MCVYESNILCRILAGDSGAGMMRRESGTHTHKAEVHLDRNVTDNIERDKLANLAIPSSRESRNEKTKQRENL